MIKIAYCPDCLGNPVVASNAPGATHVHEDETETTCTVIEVNEIQPESYPHTTTDETEVADPDAWLSYLAKYTP